MFEKVVDIVKSANGVHTKQIYKQLNADVGSMTQLKQKLLKNLENNHKIVKKHSLRLEKVNSSQPLPKLSNKSNLVTLPDGTKAIAHSQWLWYTPESTPAQFSEASTDNLHNVLPPHNSMRAEKKQAHLDQVKFNRENREVPKVAPPKDLLDGFQAPSELHTSVRDGLSRHRQQQKVVKNLKYWQKVAGKVSIAEEAFRKGQESAR
ncbi:hypothetical protein E3Q08_02974 [Wallemia mellicola]|uniref:Uncharacterized protein n=1 Tax=Wallemia mellicola TaxID=1708541 RepID=A0AB38MU69_9BASI|nr:hypothetical protein E3Q24_02656 [Wallemia mellicola]TIC04099.1 hypothetical protein E3Q16_02835 [Wallemia mellicola]TIC10970.1 hypothetical protein E3Q15_02847 [Wallemia mellicola]TIC16211.1 hypothetical protein E3Q13_03087 [Wallemia mellicola]TIC27125.1 hypothetical protein E3Q11_02725 [Wallemia mellicola]